MTTTTEKQTIIEASIKLRKATSEDFRETIQTYVNNELATTYKPKLGQPFWLRSLKTGDIDNRNYRITEHTDWPEFKQYLRLEMVYVPAGYFELKDAEL